MINSQPKIPPFPAGKWIVLALALFSFGMSALISDTVFERLPHLEDEVAYLFQARTIIRGDLVIPSPELRRAFWQPFVVDADDTRFGKYTIGYPLQLAAGEAMGLAWVINALLSMLTVALVYRLARELFDAHTGVIAAALTAFSPAALLLNATLMGHTSALFTATLFIYAYWRITQEKSALTWGMIAGVALGVLIANRPLTGISIAAPFAVYSVVRLIRVVRPHPQRIDRTLNSEGGTITLMLRPLIPIGLIAFVFALLIPLYNAAATGNPRANLYTYVWSYDTIGFGECCGRSGHTLEKGIRHLRFDMSLTAADLFGFAAGRVTPAIQDHLRTESDYFPIVGLSFALFPFGLIVAFRRKVIGVALWTAVLIGWAILPFAINDGDLTRDPTFAWVWVIAALGWVMLPMLFWRDERKTWAWLLVAVILTTVGLQLLYWIGSQRYSTRYYYEALTSIAILSALPLSWLIRRVGKEIVYGVLAVALAWSLYNYSTPRITALYRFNNIHHDLIDGVNERRTSDRPVLVIINGDDVRWRAFGSLMAVTNPYLDSDIVAAQNYRGAASDEIRQQLIEMFPDREVIELQAAQNQAWFEDELPPG